MTKADAYSNNENLKSDRIEQQTDQADSRDNQQQGKTDQSRPLSAITHLVAMSDNNPLDIILDTLQVGVAIIDKKGEIIKSNSMFEKTWGPKRPHVEQIVDYKKYKAWWANTGKPVQPEEWASARAVQKGITVTGQLLKIERVDGTHAFVTNSASPIFDCQGNIAGAIVTIHDITEQKRAEHQIKNLAQFPEENPFPVLRFNGDGTILYSNKPGYVLLKQWNRQLGQKVPEDFLQMISKALKTEQYYVEEVVCGERIISFAVVPVVDDGYVNLYGRDITGHKQTEKKLRETNEELSQFNRLAVNRELRMIELKKEINALCEQANLPLRYPMDPEEGLPVAGNKTGHGSA